MVLKSTIKDIVTSQRDNLQKSDLGVIRDLLAEIDLDIPYVYTISGIRRCGKSTLLRQLIKKVKNYYYFNFEDLRLADFKLNDFLKLEQVFKELYGESDYYFFDEIQNIDGWERYIRQLHDEEKKVIITGSNASLLSRELGTKLTGRHITKELYPFSYKEMLRFVDRKPTVETLLMYQKSGGFPNYIKYGREEILQDIFRDILFRDIIVRYGIREDKTIQDLARHIISNAGKEFSYNKLRSYFNIGSTNSVTSYVSYLEDSYLIFTLAKFDYSLKKQLINNKKAYPIDTAMANINSVTFSEDKGRLLETMILLELKRRNNEVYYFRDKNECDFIVCTNGKPVEAIQVCYELTESNKDREIKGLDEAVDSLKLKKGTIITFDQDDRVENKKLIPAWKWLSGR